MYRQAAAFARRRRRAVAGGLQTARKECRGSIMMETVMAVVVFALVGTAVLAGLSTTHSSGARTESEALAENIARNQMESIFALPYQPPPYAFPPISTPAGYTVTATAEELVVGDPNIEKVVVTVSYWGRDTLTLETLMVRD